MFLPPAHPFETRFYSVRSFRTCPSAVRLDTGGNIRLRAGDSSNIRLRAGDSSIAESFDMIKIKEQISAKVIADSCRHLTFTFVQMYHFRWNCSKMCATM